MNPSTSVPLDAKQAAAVLRLLDALEEDDDVQQVYANAEIPDDVLEFGRLTGARPGRRSGTWSHRRRRRRRWSRCAARWCTAAACSTPAGIEDAERLFLLSGLITSVVRRAPAQRSPPWSVSSSRPTAAPRCVSSEARGVLLCALAAAGIPVFEYTPNEVKEAVAGYGAARKPQVQRMTRQLLVRGTHRGPGRRRRCLRDRCLPPPSRCADAARPQPRSRAAVSALDTAVAAARARLEAAAGDRDAPRPRRRCRGRRGHP